MVDFIFLHISRYGNIPSLVYLLCFWVTLQRWSSTGSLFCFSSCCQRIGTYCLEVSKFHHIFRVGAQLFMMSSVEKPSIYKGHRKTVEEKVHILSPRSNMKSVHISTHVQNINSTHELIVLLHNFRAINFIIFFSALVPSSCFGNGFNASIS